MNASFLRTSLRTLLLFLLAACSGKAPPAPAAAGAVGGGLEIVDLRTGTGPAIAAGQRAVMQYTGWLYEMSAPDKKGRQFDSTASSGQPFRFKVGAGEVIKGWDQGVAGMKVGGQRRLTIPSELGYGDVGAGGVIPPGATLIFDVELAGIE